MADTIVPYMGRTALEIGAGIGSLTRYLSARRNLYIATDRDAEHVEQLRMLFRHPQAVRVAKLDAAIAARFRAFPGECGHGGLPERTRAYPDNAAALTRIRTALRENGRIILLVPNDPKAFAR